MRWPLSDKQRWLILGLMSGIVSLVVLGWRSGTSWPSQEASPDGLAKPSDPAYTVVGTVNGEPLFLGAIEDTRRAIANAKSPSPTPREAYQQAIQYQVREAVLRQEAVKRGLSVSDDEAQQFLAQQMALAEQSPAAKQLFQDQAKALGLDNKQYEAYLLDIYKEALLGKKLLDQLSREGPTPTEAEQIDKPASANALILIPIRFSDTGSARQVLAELQSLQSTQSSDQLGTSVISYARRINNRQPPAFVHETFVYSQPSELPDYAQDAINKPERSLNLFQRPDGTAVVYFVLKSVPGVSSPATPGLGKSMPPSVGNVSYGERAVQQWVAQANVQIFYDRLPPEARP